MSGNPAGDDRRQDRPDAEKRGLDAEQGQAVPLRPPHPSPSPPGERGRGEGAPEERRHRPPLLLVFAIMNRPHVLDLRPGHSFVEYMLRRGYDLYLLDWGAPGPEDRHLTFDDSTLEYLPRVVRKVKPM